MEDKKLNNFCNLGCGNRYHPDWINIDFTSSSSNVISYNLLKGIPYPDNSFDVVYHNNVLEHFQKDKAIFFISECYRVLKKGGVLRVVVPNLENIVQEYVVNISKAMTGDKIAEANYDWIMLEMYDQTVRNIGGGEMAKYLMQENIVNECYIFDRCGNVVKDIRNSFMNSSNKKQFQKGKLFRIIFRSLKRGILQLNNTIGGKRYQIGKFRLSGEVHQWMYDRFSLKRLFEQTGFKDIEVKNAFESNIQNWNTFQLDVKDGAAHAPQSLYMEGFK